MAEQLDFDALLAAIAVPFRRLRSTSGDTLRSAEPFPDDDPACPCLMLMPPALSPINWSATGVDGEGSIDALILCDAGPDPPRRARELSRWLGPALAATAAHLQVGMPGWIASARVTEARAEMAGMSAVWQDLPYDTVRLRIEFGFRGDLAVAP